MLAYTAWSTSVLAMHSLISFTGAMHAALGLSKHWNGTGVWRKVSSPAEAVLRSQYMAPWRARYAQAESTPRQMLSG